MAPKTSTASPVCEIGTVEDCVRVSVGPGRASEIQKCYEEWACECVARQCPAALLVGTADGDPFAHLAARDAIGSIILAGVPAGFRLAVVARNAPLIAVYDAVVVAAQRRGIEARRFRDEAEARAWLHE